MIDAIVQRKDRPGHYAILVSEDGNSEEEVDLALLADVNLYQPLQARESEQRTWGNCGGRSPRALEVG
jgi:hypothetical protein